MTGQRCLIALFHAGPRLGWRVVPVRTLPVDGRLVESDNIDAD